MLTMIGTAYFIWKAANEMSKNRLFGNTSKLLKGFAIMLVALPLAPYTVDDFVFWVHMSILGCALILAGVASGQIAAISRSKIVFCLLVVQVIGLGMFIYTFNMDRADFVWRMQFVYELMCVAALFLILHRAADSFDKSPAGT